MAILTVKSGGHTFYVDDGNQTTTLQQMKTAVVDILESEDIDEKVDNFFKKFAVPASVAVGAWNISSKAFAAATDIGAKMKPLLEIIQDLALPVGIIVASWGLIEIIMGNYPGGKEKIKYALIGFVGMFVIPEIFYTIKDAFRQ